MDMSSSSKRVDPSHFGHGSHGLHINGGNEDVISTFRRKVKRFNNVSRTRNDECPDCRENGIVVCDSSEGTQLCSTCGLVIESRIVSDEQEWRNFGNDDSGKGSDRNRVGEVSDIWLETSVAGTTFIKANKKLQHLNMMTQINKSDQTLISAFHVLKIICDTFSLRSNVIERAKEITKELQDLRQLKSRTNTLNMLAVVYLACREAGQIKSIKELIVFDRSFKEKDLGKTINKLKKVLPVRASAYNENISHLIYSLSNRLQLSEDLIEIIEYVVKRATTLITTSHRLNSLCGGSIYLVVEINNCSNDEYMKLPTLSQIASVCGVTSNTLKTTFKELLNASEYILPKHYLTNDGKTLMLLKQKYLADDKKRKKTLNAQMQVQVQAQGQGQGQGQVQTNAPVPLQLHTKIQPKIEPQVQVQLPMHGFLPEEEFRDEKITEDLAKEI